MFNPYIDQEVHILRHKELLEEAERREMVATLTQRHTRLYAPTKRLGDLLATLGNWLARSAQRDKQPT